MRDSERMKRYRFLPPRFVVFFFAVFFVAFFLAIVFPPRNGPRESTASRANKLGGG